MAHDLYYLFSVKKFNPMLPKLLPALSIRQAAETAFKDTVFVSVHRRWHPSCPKAKANPFCVDGKYKDACSYTQQYIRDKLGPENVVKIVLFTDGQGSDGPDLATAARYDATFEHRSKLPFQQEMWAMTLSVTHFGNPLSCIDYVVAHWRGGRDVRPRECWDQVATG